MLRPGRKKPRGAEIRLFDRIPPSSLCYTAHMTAGEWKEKYIGEKEFYAETLRIAAPLSLQSLLMSCQEMIDTLMVSWIGMVSAVGTAAQLFNLSGMVSYGINGSISMFAAQYYGAGDYRNLKRCTGLSLLLTTANAALWILLATFAGEAILSFYMDDPQVVADGMRYLGVAKYALVFGALSFSLSNMFRNTQQPRIALIVSIIGTCVNITLNWLLIFGVGAFPRLGVEGAALATVIARALSFLILLFIAVRTRQPFLGSIREMFSLDWRFLKPIFNRIWPLIVNESTFGFGQTLFVRAFGRLGKPAMDAYYTGLQVFNLMTFIIYGYGSAVQILLGAKLGRGQTERAKKECDYHIALAGFLSLALVLILIFSANGFVSLFLLQDPAVEATAVRIVHVFAVKASMRLYNFMIFCILRAGGDAKIIQLLDSGLEWAVGVPLAFLCVDAWGMTDIALVLLVTQIEQLVRLILGMKRVRTYKWAVDLTKVTA